MELRKRKRQPSPDELATLSTKMRKKARRVKQKLKQAVAPGPHVTDATIGGPRTGSTVELDTFGGELIICAQYPPTGTRCTLKELVEGSGAGVVLFTYERAGRAESMLPSVLAHLSSGVNCSSTRLITGKTQACVFRDAYARLSSSGLTVYGLTSDAPNANVTLKTMNRLPFALLSDPAGRLITAIGFKKQPKGTIHGVFVIDKAGKVLASETGGPAGMVKVLDNLVGTASTQHNTGVQENLISEPQDTGHNRMDSAVESAFSHGGIPSQPVTAAPLEDMRTMDPTPRTMPMPNTEPMSMPVSAAAEGLPPSTAPMLESGMPTEHSVPPTTMGGSVVPPNAVQPLASSA